MQQKLIAGILAILTVTRTISDF